MRNYCYIIFFCLLIAGNLFSQKTDSTYINQYELSEVEVSTNRFKSTIDESPTKIELIDNKKIDLVSGNKLSEVLKTAHTTHIKSYGGTPSLNQISMNGLGSSQTLVMIDGVKINSPQNSQVDLSIIPNELIENIEILNNGASALYGSAAVGGVVNIISKTNGRNVFDQTLGAGIELSYGSYNDRKITGNISLNNSKLRSNVFYSYNEGDGDFKYYFENGSDKIEKERENSSFRIRNFGGNFTYFFNDHSKLRYFVTFVNQDIGTPGIEVGGSTSKARQRDRNWNNILSYEYFLSKLTDLKISLNFQNNLNNYDSPPVTFSQHKNLIYSTNAQINQYGSFYKLNFAYDFTHSYLISSEMDIEPIRNQHAATLAAQLELPAGIKIFPNIRVESFSDLDTNIVTGKIGMNYQPVSDYKLFFRGGLGWNFRAPSFNDLYWTTGGNRDLKPEWSRNYEAGLIWYPSKSIDGYLDFGFNYIEFQNQIVWIPNRTGIWSPMNVNNSLSRIFSISIFYKKKLNESLGINADCGAVFNDSQKTSKRYENDPTENKQLIYVPRSTFKTNLLINVYEFDLGIFYSFADVSFSDLANKRPMDPYHIVNFNIRYNFKIYSTNNSLKFEINNLTNSDYQVISGYPMPLRNYKLLLSINY